ncbi:MAG: hypothetical protein FJ098_06445, partial [Deltaproteobacteria bacterium]|nr:hypothetical protein [Deltaproteobacteria bacterium]
FTVGISPGHGVETGSEDQRIPYVSGASCASVPCPGGEECLGYCCADGGPCGDDDDCPMGERCVRICARPVWLDVDAVLRDGTLYAPPADQLSPWRLWVELDMHPGFVPPPFRMVRLENGRARNVKTYIARAVGESHLWVEDTGLAPVDGTYGECNDGADNDGDGLADLADPDCADAADGREDPATWATGLSPTFWFETPRIRHLQYTGDLASSPLEGDDVEIAAGRMVVTNVGATGFFVTDLDDQRETLPDGAPGYFNSLFLYTFNKPVGIGYGDTLCALSGGVVEYQGNTQIKFPSFEILEEVITTEQGGRSVRYGKCKGRIIPGPDVDLKVPAPVDVTDLLVAEDPSSPDFRDQILANARGLEPFESGLVTVRDLAMSTRFLACDADENGNIDSLDEDACRDACQEDPACTQLESFFEYQQVSVQAAKGKKLQVALDMIKDLVPLDIAFIGQADMSGRCGDGTDPLTGEPLANPHKILLGETLFTEYLCPPMPLASVSGNYRQIYLCDTGPCEDERCTLILTMILPRFDDDVVLAEEDVP